jgi:peptidoglycan/LPS O-acetylase OafA/YrhL
LTAAPLRFFGKYSYGLYIIHGLLSPVLFARLPDTLFIAATHSVVMGVFACVIVRIASCTVAAFLSWHLFEKRFLRLKRYFRKDSERPAMSERAAS